MQGEENVWFEKNIFSLLFWSIQKVVIVEMADLKIRK